MKKLLIIGLFIAVLFPTMGQKNVLSLDSCLNAAERNNPAIRLFGLTEENYIFKEKSLKTSWYPSLTLNAQATWQNEVTNIDIDLPIMPQSLTDISKDQYRISLDLRQNIWDGGVTAAMLDYERAAVVSETEKIKKDMFHFKEQIVDLYFAILKLQSQQEVLMVKKWQLLLKVEDLNKAAASGVVLKETIDMLNAEELVVEQKIIELDYEIAASKKMLGRLMDVPISEDAMLLLPSPELSLQTGITTSDETYLHAMQNQLSSSDKMLKTSLMPKVFAFSQLGYGRPGLNMLSNEFEPFVIVGAKMVWTPWDWGKSKSDRQQIQVQQSIIDTQIEQINYLQQSQLDAQMQRIEKCEKLMEKDEEIITLKHNITEAVSLRLNCGTATSTDYLNALNDEQAAQGNYNLHIIMLAEAKVKYNLLKGIMYEK
ncbi:MAG: TolC family protein [Bacteroidales bacterium]|nr:TolC family protein [Bacteroidales bacterium]HOY38003.1 TolC family protein [Bacteroidales bacterium]HQP04315.1 TolC family protein [Bacteroidales bacterium]